MCETVHNNMTFTTVEQKIACEYIEAYLRSIVILLKTAYFKHFEYFPSIEIFKKLNFAANQCEYV